MAWFSRSADTERSVVRCHVESVQNDMAERRSTKLRTAMISWMAGEDLSPAVTTLLGLQPNWPCYKPPSHRNPPA